jgi:hypothetical protein
MAEHRWHTYQVLQLQVLQRQVSKYRADVQTAETGTGCNRNKLCNISELDYWRFINSANVGNFKCECYCSGAGGTLDLTASGGTMGIGAIVHW